MKYLIQGRVYDPILCGDETDWYFDAPDDATCGDCGVHKGEQHLPNCDIERCPACGLQFFSCDCQPAYDISEEQIQDKTYIRYLTLRQLEEVKQVEKAIKLLMNKEITKDEYMAMFQNDIFPEKRIASNETKMDFLDRIYCLRDNYSNLCQQIDILQETCIKFEELHNGLSGITDIAMEDITSCDEIKDFVIKNADDINKLKILLSEDVVDDYYYKKDVYGAINNLRKQDVNEAINNVATYVVGQLEHELKNENEQE